MGSAVRFDATTERLNRTTGVLSFDTNYSVLAWVRITTHPGNGNGACVLSIDDQSANADECYVSGNGATNLSLGIVTVTGGSGLSDVGTATFLAGTWQYVAFVRSANNLRVGYRNGVAEVTHTRDLSGRTSPTMMSWGSVLDSDLFNGRIAHMLLYRAALTVPEILRQMYTIQPVRTQDLYGWYPTLPGSGNRGRDASGLGNHLTEVGTLADEEGPPVAWRKQLWMVPFFVDAGGDQNITVTDSATGTDAIASIAASVAVTDSGAGADQATLGASSIAVADSATGTDAVSIAASAAVADSAAGTDYVVAGELTGACVAGVLRRDSTNGRYVRNDTGIVFLAGHHTWYNTQDGGTSDPPAAFDWSGYVTALQAKGLNFTKLWRLESARDWPSASGQYFGIQPWVRSGPGNANDGHLKFDLAQFNQAYFDRIRLRCIQLGAAGIHAVVQLFDGFHVDATKPGGGVGDPWHYHPFNSSNNINGVNGDTNADGKGLESRLTTNTAAYAVQQAYIRKMVDTLNDLDNIIFEIANEEDPTAETWEKALVDYIHSYESGKPKQHIIGMTKLYPSGTNSMLTSSNADWISPDEDLTPAAQTSTSQAWFYDTDHTVGITTDRKWMWVALCQGFAGAWYMDLWDSGAGGAGDTRSDATYELIRKNLGWAQTYAAKMDLVNATPQGSLSATGYCLAKTSGTKHQYLAYQSGSGSFTVDLSATSGTLSVEWVRVGNSAGTVQAGSSVNGGATRTLTPPWAGEDAVAYLEQDVPKAVADSGTGTESIAISVALGIADTGVGADGPSGATVTLSLADTGAGTDDTLQEILAAIAESGAAVDSLASITVTFTVPDTGSGSESLVVAATVSVADAGGGADAVSVLTEAIIQVADSGAGIDTVISPLVSVAVLDTGSGVDSQAISVTLAVADAGSAADLIDVITAVLVSILDSGSGADELTVSVDPFGVTDSATGSDTAGVAVSLAIADTGSGADDVLQMILVAIADLATGTDAVGSISVNVPVADAGQAADALGAIAAALSVADVGSGLDVAVQFDSAVKLVSIVFTLARRTVVFTWSARSIEFGWNVA